MSATQTSSVLLGAGRSSSKFGAIGPSWSLWVVRTLRRWQVRPWSRSTRLWLHLFPPRRNSSVMRGLPYRPRLASNTCWISEQVGYDFGLLKQVQKINAEQMERFVKKISDTLWVLKDKKIGVLGLAFKQNTDDVRLSPAIDLCHRLQKEGAILRVHDPKAMDKAKAILTNVTYVEDMNDLAEGCDALVIATEWDEFKKLDLERARKAMTHPITFDGRNLFDPAEMERLGFIYKSIGR